MTGSQTTRATTSETQSQTVSWDEDEPYSPSEVMSGKRKPKWLQEILKGAQSMGTPKREARESKVPERFCSYVAMVSSISESEPSSYRQAAGEQVWRDAMVEEYASIMKNSLGNCVET